MASCLQCVGRANYAKTQYTQAINGHTSVSSTMIITRSILCWFVHIARTTNVYRKMSCHHPPAHTHTQQTQHNDIRSTSTLLALRWCACVYLHELERMYLLHVIRLRRCRCSRRRRRRRHRRRSCFMALVNVKLWQHQRCWYIVRLVCDYNIFYVHIDGIRWSRELFCSRPQSFVSAISQIGSSNQCKSTFGRCRCVKYYRAALVLFASCCSSAKLKHVCECVILFAIQSRRFEFVIKKIHFSFWISSAFSWVSHIRAMT